MNTNQATNQTTNQAETTYKSGLLVDHTITLTRALSALKTLDKRISEATMGISVNGTNPLGYLIASPQSVLPRGCASDTELSTLCDAAYFSMLDLIEYRDRLKTAIAKKNADTLVTICGENMTILEALERKASIHQKQLLVSNLRSHQRALNMQLEGRMEQVQKIANDAMAAQPKADTDHAAAEASAESRKALFNQMITLNKPRLVTMRDMAERIEQQTRKLEQFIAEVDHALSEANATTTIVVDA